MVAALLKRHYTHILQTVGLVSQALFTVNFLSS
jgi:hypothetical protein